MVSTKQLNWFPAKGGESKYIIQHEIMYGHNLESNKHWQIPFWAYKQVAKDNNLTNTNAPRKLHGIYLQPQVKKQEGQKCMHIYTGQVITVYNVKDIPVT